MYCDLHIKNSLMFTWEAGWHLPIAFCDITTVHAICMLPPHQKINGLTKKDKNHSKYAIVFMRDYPNINRNHQNLCEKLWCFVRFETIIPLKTSGWSPPSRWGRYHWHLQRICWSPWPPMEHPQCFNNPIVISQMGGGGRICNLNLGGKKNSTFGRWSKQTNKSLSIYFAGKKPTYFHPMLNPVFLESLEWAVAKILAGFPKGLKQSFVYRNQQIYSLLMLSKFHE